ncbi:MAG: GYF domain-containing protein [Acidobacteriota bacterium]|nr:GYF domain-containing protein [Acidobacteriota bacterium]
MNYFVKRDVQEYGPYTLSELQRYTSSGNVLLTDLCRSEGMTDWAPVSQVIGNIPVPVPSSIAPAAGGFTVSPFPPPPSLHWGVVILLAVITCGIFGWVWALVQASWMKKVEPASKALLYYGISVGLILLASATNIYQASQGLGRTGAGAALNLIGWVLWLVASFSMRTSIEEHFSSADPVPSAMSLSGGMTFFFNVYYFQYHFTKVNEQKKRQGMYV